MTDRAPPPADWQARERAILAPWAMHGVDSAGREHDEPPHAFRSPYQRDRDRVVHSAAFRRLAHKTQVFTGYHGDYHRSRLTHTLEVTGIARTLARGLGLNEDLVEALALAHDIGHPPLGHAGEDTLDHLLADAGGFNHNRQALRIMTLLEARYPGFPGLNLSREVLDAQRSRAEKSGPCGRLLEAQVVDAADSIAYDTHDADDAVELGLVRLEELLDLPPVAAAATAVRDRLGTLDAADLRRAVLHELIERQVADLLDVTRAALRQERIGSADDARAHHGPLVRHGAAVASGKGALERFLFDRVYRSERVMGVRLPAQRRLEELFRWYVAHPDRLPAGYRERAATGGLLRSIGDYIAGMTDRYLERDHAARCGD